MRMLEHCGKIPQKKLLIIEDDDILRHYLGLMLNRNGFVVDSCAQGEALPRQLKKYHIDLVILDIELPGKDGMYWLKWLQQYYQHIPVILASAHLQCEERWYGLENGARDYILKPFHDKELLFRIQNALGESKTNYLPERYLKIGEARIDTEKSLLLRYGQTINLTQLETNILKLLYLSAGIPLSREEIMLQIWGNEFNPLDRSIDIHINKIRKKLEVNPAQPTHIRTIRGKGYCLQL